MGAEVRLWVLDGMTLTRTLATDAEVLRAALDILNTRRMDLVCGHPNGARGWRPAGLGDYIAKAAAELEAAAKGDGT